MQDPFSGEKQLITLDRTGHTEQKLIVALANPDLSRDQKDHALSMYLYERGAQNTSMIVDLMRYKGKHTKESRVFQSRMRLDFDTFVRSFCSYLELQAAHVERTIGVNIDKERAEFEEWLKLPNNQGKGYGYKDFADTQRPATWSLERIALIEMALYAKDEAVALKKGVDDIVKAREAMKGGGVYIDKMGRPYSVNDPHLADIIKAEQEAEAEANSDEYVA